MGGGMCTRFSLASLCGIVLRNIDKYMT